MDRDMESGEEEEEEDHLQSIIRTKSMCFARCLSSINIYTEINGLMKRKL